MKTMMINKILSVLAVFFFCLTTFTAGAANLKGDEILYLKPGTNWKQSNPRYALYLFTKNGNEVKAETWVNMTDCNGDGTFEVVVPPGDWANLIFCRMDGATSDNNWSNRWNQTGDLTYTIGKNKFTVPNNSWDGAKSTWSSQSPTTAQYKILGLGKDWTWDNGLTFGPHSDANNKKEVMYQCLDVQETEAIKVVRNEICYYGQGIVKSGSVAVTYDKDGNIVLSKGVYDLYFDKTTNQLYIGYATPTKVSLVGLGQDIDMPKEGDQYVLKDIEVKSTDKVKVKLVYDCGNIEYVTLDDASCSTVESTNEGLTFQKDGYYDFYFKSDKTIYVGANESNPANADKYYLMGVDGDWDKADESNQLTQNPNNADELVLLGQKISQSDSKADAIKIVKKSICAVDLYYAEVKPSSTVIYTGGGTGVNPPNIVLEDGTYDFYFNKTSGQIYITGSIKNARVVYLDPKVENGSDWESDGARMAIYYFKSSNTNDNGWIGASYCDGYYYAYLPEGYDKYDWCRMNPDGENNWENRWNQTNSITYSEAEPLTKLKEMEKNSYQTPYNGTCGISYDNLDCNFPILNPGDTLYVHINQFEDSDPCNYKFSSFEQAFAVLKNNDQVCTSSTCIYGSIKEDEITLKVPVVMLVHYGPEPYRGTEKVGMSGGHIYDAPAIFFRNINKNGVVTDGEGKTVLGHTLIVRTADPKGNRAVIVHPVIRRSTNIVLDNLDVVSDPTLRDNAIDIDTGIGMGNLEGLDQDYNIVELSEMAHNITLKNCVFESYGRNCIHVVGINGIHVENNEFYTKYNFSVNASEGEDVVDWGGTIKFINTQNVKFLRNDSEGTLATSFFIQGCQRVLLMNNVFWNDNAVAVPNVASEGRSVANVRLVNYGAQADKFPIKNIGIYYNTFFIKDNDAGVGSYHKFDFFRLGGLQQPVMENNAGNKYFDPTTIRFQYNNCYSYDEDIEGNNDVYDVSDEKTKLTYYLQGIGQSEDWCQCFKYNNFWSKWDEQESHSSSSFEIGKFCTGTKETYNLYANVSEQVCTTPPQRPGALVVKGDRMNIGTMITEEEDVSKQGAHLIFNDRLNPDNGVNSIRPQMSVDNSNEALSPYDHIYLEPGTINLFTSPIVGSQTTDVMITSIKLTAKKDVNLSIVDENDDPIWSVGDPIEDKRFAITDATGTEITSLTTDANGALDNAPVYVTFVRPEGVNDYTKYEAFLKVVPSQSADAQLILRIPLRGHYQAQLNSIPGAWTVGAFQQREAMPVDTIVWHGSATSQWDNRNNWYKTDGTLVTCLDALTDDLTVIIPKKNSEKYRTPAQGVVQYPKLPKLSSDEEFTTKREAKWHGEQVNAGNSGQVANKIFLEYGATLVGVERLGSKRYSEVEMEFIARRHDWLLVGPVVRPWELDENGNQVLENKKPKARDVVSGDYFLNYFPHVYMHRAEVKLKEQIIEASWNTTFADLDSVVNHEKAFAIWLPDEYGYNLDLFGEKTEKISAKWYNMFFCGGEQVYDGDEPYTYTFKGRFYNESSLPTYDIRDYEAGVPIILNNSYPANIDAQKLQEGLSGDAYPVQYYNYETKGFNAVGDDEKSIMSQHSFIIVPKTGLETLVIDSTWFQTTETGHRSASENIESFRIELRNKAKSSASEIYVRYDALKDDEENNSLDAPKIFNTMEASLPDLYTKRYNKKWAGLVIPTISEPIPLGINVSMLDQEFTFSLKKSTMNADVILEDRLTEKQYNLSAGERCYVDDLKIGTCEGRFYLMLQERELELPEDDEVTTEVEDNQTSNGGIDLFTQGNSVVVSASSDIELQEVIISDMTGRHQVYNVSGQYVQINLPVNTGVYTISVIGDKQIRVEKIKLN